MESTLHTEAMRLAEDRWTQATTGPQEFANALSKPIPLSPAEEHDRALLGRLIEWGELRPPGDSRERRS